MFILAGNLLLLQALLPLTPTQLTNSGAHSVPGGLCSYKCGWEEGWRACYVPLWWLLLLPLSLASQL